MRVALPSGRRVVSLVAAATVVAGFAVSVALAPAASADPAPVAQPSASTVTADALPTVQIDGVVWSQAVVGNTVYAGGEFTTARPAGAAAGVDTTPRGNLLAYDLTTGVLISSFAPSLNRQVRVVTASPDGSRVYVGGDFTTADGVDRYRIAAYSTSTGQLISSFAPVLDYVVKSIVATNTTVYVGGSFSSANGNTRTRLAAFNASDGALLGWNPSADNDVNALVLTPDGSRIIAGGAFQYVNGASAYGLAAIDASTGALLPWAANSLVRDAGANSAILSLTTDGTAVYGSGYVFGSGGNLEGTFSADPNSGTIHWIEDCHGDTYSTYPSGGQVYVVGHQHYCGNVGGYPQTSPWTYHRGLAFTTNATGTLLHNTVGNYYDYGGQPSPTMINWFPDLDVGTYTGLSQAAWNVTGNSQYVVMGGEFPKVNNTAQQGLVRFAVKPIAPAKQAPRVSGASFVPTLLALSPTSLRVSWQTNWDRDDENLTYNVYRNSSSLPAIYTTTYTSQFWNRPYLNYIDTGLTPGATYKYKVIVTDTSGNAVAGNFVSITVPTSQSAYSAQVVADGAGTYWPLDEASGTVVYDHVALNDADAGTGVTRGTTGPISGGTASTFSGTSTGTAATRTAVAGPNTFTLETWVRTSTTKGGKVIGFGTARTGSSSSFDRHIYLANNGRVYFGVYNGSATTVNSTTSVNNGAWHQLVASLGAGSMKLYLDGSLVAQRTGVNSAETFNGYWRVGGDNLNSWTSKPSSTYLAGDIGQVAIFPTALSAAQIATHYTQVTTGALANQAPTAAFTTSAADLAVSMDGSSSSDPDGTIASDAWDFGDGTTGTGATASHTYAAGGTYTITLTVTDNRGATNAVSHAVTVTPANVAPTAAFTASASGLALSVDGSASSDSDGTVVSYAWNFGDGATGTGATASHTYGSSGTYTVTLTVTDDRGGTGTATKQVTVTAPNVPPTAAFTASTSDLAVSVDGSASSDPDGSVASYAWDFGDGATGAGLTASHSYAAAGTYAVTLTVTDNQGATGTASKNVTVLAGAAVYAADTFARTTSSGWGSADTGGAWSVTGGSSNFSVAPGSGNIKMSAAGAGPYAYLNGVSVADSNSVVDFTLDKAPTGGGTYVSLAARRTGTSDYRVRAKLLATGAVQVSLTKVVSGTETALATQTVSGLTFAVGTTLRMRLQVSGSSSVALSGKVWAVGTTEPAGWQVAATDASTPFGAGAVGLVSYLSGSSTNAPVVASFANFTVSSIAGP